MIAVLFTAYSMSASQHLPFGGWNAHACRPGSRTVPRLAGRMSFALAEPLVMPICSAASGPTVIFLTNYLGIDIQYAWVGLAALCAAIVWLLTYRGIGLSTRAGIVLGAIEIVIFLLISALLIVNAPQNTISVFIPADGNVLPAFQGMIFCLLAFIGFAVAPLGEEAREPRRTIPWAVDLVGGPGRAVLCLQLLRRDGVLRAGSHDRVPVRSTRAIRGASWRMPSYRSVDSLSCSRSSTAASRTAIRN